MLLIGSVSVFIRVRPTLFLNAPWVASTPVHQAFPFNIEAMEERGHPEFGGSDHFSFVTEFGDNGWQYIVGLFVSSTFRFQFIR